MFRSVEADLLFKYKVTVVNALRVYYINQPHSFCQNWPKCARNKIFHHYLQDYLLSGKNQSSNLWWLIPSLPLMLQSCNSVAITIVMHIQNVNLISTIRQVPSTSFRDIMITRYAHDQSYVTRFIFSAAKASS